MDELGDIVQEFLVESHENLDQLDRDLVALEQTPDSRELLSSVFRTIHTIKGTSGFLAFHTLERVTHIGESLLSRLRDGAQEMTPEVADALLRMVDVVRALLAAIEETGGEGEVEVDGVIDVLTACVTNGSSAVVPAAPAASQPSPAAPITPAAQTGPVVAALVPDGDPGPTVTVRTEVTVTEPTSSTTILTGTALPAETAPGTPGVAAAGTTGKGGKSTPNKGRGRKATPAGPTVVGAETADTAAAARAAAAAATAGVPVSEAMMSEATMPDPSTSGASSRPPSVPVTGAHGTGTAGTAGQGTAGQGTAGSPASTSTAADHDDHDPVGGRRSVAESSVRVDVELLDGLMRLVGELVLTRNQLVRAIGTVADPVMARTGQRLNLITSELQESVMKTRMQAIDHLWAKLPRVVRDLSSTLGKQVRLVMVGADTELDRSLLEAVKDPLTHLVRNAVDHGIEAPEARAAAGKPAMGTLTLRAFHEGGHVIVEVSDDGAGIDPDKIARVAVERGVVSREQVATMDRREMFGLLFRPGFSTAAAVTNVSGRGVGMDVVKTNIERIGGAVDIDSTVGLGSTWRLTIPLTLAIIQALTIQCAGQRYVIPQVAVHELVYLDGQSGRVVERAMGAPVYRLRGKLLPLVYLHETLNLSNESDPDRDVYVVVLQAEGRRFGLVVDRVLNTEEVVVKPLTARLKDIGVYAGATLLGDGQVALILDVVSLARRSHLTTVPSQDADLHAGDGQDLGALTASGARGGGDRLLIAGVGDRRVAIPLDMVTRLEEFPTTRIERAGSREVVQYRDQILPVLRLADLLGVHQPETDTLPVIVYTENNRSVALAVQHIIDIVTEHPEQSHRDFGDSALIGSAVIQQRVTELLDVRAAILAADPMFHMTDSIQPDHYAVGTR